MALNSRKMQLFFKSNAGYGWSEDYWIIPPNSGPALSTFVSQFVPKRAKFLTQDTEIVRVRIATNHKRDPQIFDYEGVASAVGGYAANVNNTANAVLVRFEAVDVGFNRLMMRGIPDVLIDSGDFVPNAQWLQGFNAFRTFITGGGVFQVVASVDNPQMPIPALTLSLSAGKGFIVTVDPLIPALTTDRVRISGCKVPGYNGRKHIVMKNPNGLPSSYLLGGAKPPADEPASPTTFMTPLIQLEGATTVAFYERFTERRPGRFFGEQPGRARTLLTLRP